MGGKQWTGDINRMLYIICNIMHKPQCTEFCFSTYWTLSWPGTVKTPLSFHTGIQLTNPCKTTTCCFYMSYLHGSNKQEITCWLDLEVLGWGLVLAQDGDSLTVSPLIAIYAELVSCRLQLHVIIQTWDWHLWSCLCLACESIFLWMVDSYSKCSLWHYFRWRLGRVRAHPISMDASLRNSFP